MQRSVPLAARLLGLLALLLCGGCDVQFPQQEVRFRYDAETDTLDVLMIYRGVHTPTDSEEALAKGVDVVDRILAGRREIMFIDWPAYLDLDEEVQGEDRTPVEVREMDRRFEFVRAGAFLDEHERLCGYQQFRWVELSRSIAGINTVFNRELNEAMVTGEFSLPEDDWVGEGAEALWRDFVASDGEWCRFDGARFVVRVPVSNHGAARFLAASARDLVQTAIEDELVARIAAQLLENVTGVRVADGVAELHVGVVEGEDTLIVYDASLSDSDSAYSPALRDLVLERGLDLTGAPTLDEVRGMLGD